MRHLLTLSMLLIPWTVLAGPPSQGVCGDLKGGTPGLFGLCVAFCEAQELGDAPDSKQSAFSLLAAYESKRQPGDPDMPCLDSGASSTKPQPPTASCSCWSTDELEAAIPSPNTCSTSPEYVIASQNTLSRTSFAMVEIPSSFMSPSCSFQDTDGTITGFFGRAISEADAEGCAAVLNSFINAKGCL